MENFPYLTQQEFATAAKHLCELLSHCSNLEHRLWLLVILHECTKQEAPIHQSTENSSAEEDELAMEGDQENDSECIVRKVSQTKSAIIEYHIVLSPVYCVPVLYFNMAIDSTPASLDDVYQHLVRQSDLSKDVSWEETLRAVGVHGAISQGEHPVLGTPFWFIHPCETAALVENWGTVKTHSIPRLDIDDSHSKKGIISLQNYLQIWLGMMGSTVGLHLPVEAVTSQQVEK
ncbi:hypothetical protein BGX38DRAFT_1271836 [Terfezia claveryi]|nr:hypothetical protein BGX38DRAFT_1271836 [Terfezia claveryi]